MSPRKASVVDDEADEEYRSDYHRKACSKGEKDLAKGKGHACAGKDNGEDEDDPSQTLPLTSETSPQSVLHPGYAHSHELDRVGQPARVAYEEVEDKRKDQDEWSYHRARSLLTYAMSTFSRTIAASRSRACSWSCS